MEHFYHLLPNKMHGKELYPLSFLEDKLPALAKDYKKNYKGREKLLSKKIDLLDCKWEDVIFLSCLNPIIIFSALEILGLLDKDLPKIIKFPAKILKDKNACLFQEIGNKNEFNKFSPSKYKEEENIPVETIKYFVKCIASGENPLIFSGVKHILLNDSLSLDDGEIFKYESILK